jgi:hypothetical protein
MSGRLSARLSAWRYRWQLYRRVRWTDATVNEVELAVMGSAVLVALIALFMVWGRNG